MTVVDRDDQHQLSGTLGQAPWLMEEICPDVFKGERDEALEAHSRSVRQHLISTLSSRRLPSFGAVVEPISSLVRTVRQHLGTSCVRVAKISSHVVLDHVSMWFRDGSHASTLWIGACLRHSPE